MTSRSSSGEVFDAKARKPKDAPVVAPKILGAPEITEAKPEVLDKNTKQEQVPPEIHYQEEIVTVRQHVRAKPLRKDEPEVRIRSLTTKEGDDE